MSVDLRCKHDRSLRERAAELVDRVWETYYSEGAAKRASFRALADRRRDTGD